MRGRALKARTQPAAEYHVAFEVANNASTDRLYDMVFGGCDFHIGTAEPGEIERREVRSESLSPVPCPNEDILRGRMLAGGLWSDVAIEIVWSSPRHSGTKALIDPFHWMIPQSARLNMIPSKASMFDLSPGESSEYFDNYFSCCSTCEKRWWLVDTPVLGICPVCEVDTINSGLDVRRTLASTPHSPFVRADNGEDSNPSMGVDTSAGEADYGETPGPVGDPTLVCLDDDPDVQRLLPTPPGQIWQGSTVAVNPSFNFEFLFERYREWIDLVALDFVRTHQRRPDDPNSIYRIGGTESNRDGRVLDEPGGDNMDIDDEDADDDNVMSNKSYDSSVAVDAMLSSFEASITPLMQGEEGRGLSRLGDLSDIRHVVVVGPFCSGTNAMFEYLEKYSNVTVHPPRLPRTATGWIGDMSAPNYSRRGNHWQVGWKHLPLLNSENVRQMCSRPTHFSFR